METIRVKDNVFEVVDVWPNGYEIWNIGTNMVDGYLPLCRISQNQPFSGGRNIETDTLKAIKTEGAQLILAAIGGGVQTVEAMERYIKRYRNSKPGTYANHKVQQMIKALPYMKKIKCNI